jgi:hypothetical protein
MTTELVAAVAAAILRGAILSTPRHTVGPYLSATAPAGRWACLDLRGTPVFVDEEWKDVHIGGTSDKTGWSAELVPRFQPDWSPFGAALAFVRVETTTAVRRALRRLESPLDEAGE